MGKATAKQIEYADIIADYLGLQKPSDTFEECQQFIKDNVDEYKRKRKTIVQDLIDEGHPRYKDYVDAMGEQTLLWVDTNLKGVAGCYAFLGARNKLLYIGKSLNLAERIPSSYTERKAKAEIKKILYYITPTQADASILEMMLITENKPLLNRDGNTKDKPKMYKSGVDIKRDFKEIPLVEKGKKNG